MTKRAYDNSKRQQRSQRNRDLIIETMVEMLAEGEEDVSVAELASRSGVSVRTVYQHFPDKPARIQAINDWIDSQVNIERVLPQSYADIPDYIERLVDHALHNETLLRAQMAAGLAKQVRNYRKAVHLESLRKCLSEKFSARKVEELSALIISLVRVEAIYDMRELHQLSDERILILLRDAITAILQEADKKQASKGRSPKALK